MSLAWIVGPFWDDFPIKTMIPGLGRTTWGRYKFTQTHGIHRNYVPCRPNHSAPQVTCSRVCCSTVGAPCGMLNALQTTVEKHFAKTTSRWLMEVKTRRIHVCYIYGNIYHQYTPNVSIYTIHGSYGKEDNGWSPKIMEVSEKHIFLVGIFAVEWGKSLYLIRCFFAVGATMRYDATIGDPDRSRHFDTILEVWIIPIPRRLWIWSWKKCCSWELSPRHNCQLLFAWKPTVIYSHWLS